MLDDPTFNKVHKDWAKDEVSECPRWTKERGPTLLKEKLGRYNKEWSI